jgi:hypothetical protein
MQIDWSDVLREPESYLLSSRGLGDIVLKRKRFKDTVTNRNSWWDPKTDGTNTYGQ